MYWSRIAALQLRVEDVSLVPLELETATGWTRHSTVVRVRGDGVEGRGEDVCYETDDQRVFQRSTELRELVGTHTLAEFVDRLDHVDLWPEPPSRPQNRLYRRWALESAALDLSVRQTDSSLATILGRDAAPVEFVVSIGLGSPPTTEPLEALLARIPSLRFKIDFADNWSERTVRDLARFQSHIAVVDLKAHYHGSFQGPRAHPALYRLVAEQLGSSWLEDPALEGDAWDSLEPFHDRVTWDAILHSAADLERLPRPPRCINVKPSRFGTLRELCRVYEVCERGGIAMYGGGQFEIGPGRAQIQHLASLFHPAMPNDTAPVAFHAGPNGPGLGASPILVESRTGFGS